MIKFTKFCAVIAVVSLSFVSCLKDNDNSNVYGEECFGIISGTKDSFSVLTDGGNTLNVKETRDPMFDVQDGLRVRMNFTVLEQKGEHAYDIRVNAISKLLTKKPVRFSELTPQEIDSIGYDPIDVASAWFGAGKYLNVMFLIWGSNNSEKLHFINLAVDEKNSTEDHVIVTMKHNGFGDPRIMRGYGHVSFDISGLVPAGKKSVNVTLKWIDYQGAEQSDSGVFELKAEESAAFIGSNASTGNAKALFIQ